MLPHWATFRFLVYYHTLTSTAHTECLLCLTVGKGIISTHYFSVASIHPSIHLRRLLTLSHSELEVVCDTLAHSAQFLPCCMKCRRSLAMRILSICPSVHPSVCHMRILWQNSRKICPDLYTIRKNIYPSFLRRRMVGGGLPLLREILGQPTPVGAISPIFNQ